MTEVIEQVPTTLPQAEVLVKEIDGRKFYETQDEYGRKGKPKTKYLIELEAVNPMLLRMAMAAVKLPKRPTYQTKLPSGRTETFPMDEYVAKEMAEKDPSQWTRWEAYLEDRDEAQAERTNKSMLATFGYGTTFTPPEDGWAEEQEMMGIEVPPKNEPENRKAHFLMSVLSMKDMNGLMRAITRRMGVSEEEVAAAEDSFRDSVRN